jgi:hypothetical protein
MFAPLGVVLQNNHRARAPFVVDPCTFASRSLASDRCQPARGSHARRRPRCVCEVTFWKRASRRSATRTIEIDGVALIGLGSAARARVDLPLSLERLAAAAVHLDQPQTAARQCGSWPM